MKTTILLFFLISTTVVFCLEHYRLKNFYKHLTPGLHCRLVIGNKMHAGLITKVMSEKVLVEVGFRVIEVSKSEISPL